MVIKTFTNPNGREVCYLDDDYSVRWVVNYNKHMFHFFQNSIGKSLHILKELKDIQKSSGRKIMLKPQVINYPEEEGLKNFVAILSLENFIKQGKRYLKNLKEKYKGNAKITNEYILFQGKNTDKQIICPLQHFLRMPYREQSILKF